MSAKRTTANPRTITLNDSALKAAMSLFEILELRTGKPLSYSEMIIEAEKIVRSAVTPDYWNHVLTTEGV